MEGITALKQNFKNILVYGCETLENENEVLLSCLAKGYRDMTSARTTFKGINKMNEQREKTKEKIDLTWSTKEEKEYLILQEEIQKYVGDNESKLNYDFKVWKRKNLIDKD